LRLAQFTISKNVNIGIFERSDQFFIGSRRRLAKSDELTVCACYKRPLHTNLGGKKGKRQLHHGTNSARQRRPTRNYDRFRHENGEADPWDPQNQYLHGFLRRKMTT
jgi:hypothetical protein